MTTNEPLIESPGPSERDLQRSALRELVDLVSRSAKLESEIQSRYEAETEAARHDVKRSAWVVEQRYANFREGTKQRYDLKNLEIERQYENEMTVLKSSDENNRRRIDHDRETTERTVKKELEQAVWLAESLHEGAVNSAREEHRSTKDRAEANAGILDRLIEKAVHQIQTYRQVPPMDDVAMDEVKEEDIGEDPRADYDRQYALAEERLEDLARLKLPHLFVSAYPYIFTIGIILLAVGIAQFSTGTLQPQPKPILIGLGSGTLLATIAGIFLWAAAKRKVTQAYAPFHDALLAARRAIQADMLKSAKQRERQLEHATRKRDMEILASKERYHPMLGAAQRRHAEATQFAKAEFNRQSNWFDEQRFKAKRELDEWLAKKSIETDDAEKRELAQAQAIGEKRVRDNEERYAREMAELQAQWDQGLARIQAPIEDVARANGAVIESWTDPAWAKWSPPKAFPSAVRFGQMKVDLAQLVATPPKLLKLPETFSVPALLAFPRQASLLIHTDHAGRADGIRILQTVMARLLTGLPAGRAHFTIIDPVGLGQSFAGFMHLTDHDEALVGARIWTEREHIEQRLTDLTEHMETVIQKYLRNEFETIDDYNAQAGELAEPYRFLVIADFPVGFEGDSFRRLASIASSGARCGVYTLILRDTRTPATAESRLEELSAHSINLVRQDNKFIWRDEVFERFPLTLDPLPPEDALNPILDTVGRAAKEAKRVEVDFGAIAPADSQLWTGSTKSDVQVPVGRLGATRLQMLRLGRGVAQHALIAGKTGSGKSTLLHVMVTNLAMWYSPDEVEFYLVDFKKGVEFKTYATHSLPHARAVAVESDREFGLSVLQRIDAELTRRGELYRKLGVQDLAAYRDATEKGDGSHLSLPKLPRTLLIIDEFQEFFSEDDKLAQDASVLLDRLVRQGRAFGVHVLLGSQTIGGTSGLSRSTIGQMAVRIALQTSEADSQLILGDNNAAARLLTRPGEAIYNDQGGLVEGNSPFQVAWLPDDRRDTYLNRVHDKSVQANITQAPIIFEGNAPADIWKNQPLQKLLNQPTYPPASSSPAAWLGDPVAIKDPTSVTFRRQSGANLLVIGQQDEAALAVTASAIVSLAAQHRPGAATFHLLDGTPADSPLAGMLAKVGAVTSADVRNIEWRSVPDTISDIAEEVTRRQADESPDTPEIYLIVFGLQRYRMLRKSEESFGFSSSDEEKKSPPDKLFADILREGPAVGVHVIAWADTPATLERTFDRQSMREFDNRVLFQMSAADSSNLIDSPAANKLGQNRALAHSEERGTMEKFRPYALPTADWLNHIQSTLGARTV